jgi:hypothetical protein
MKHIVDSVGAQSMVKYDMDLYDVGMPSMGVRFAQKT